MRFALIITEMTLRHFRLWEASTAEFEKLDKERTRGKADALGMTIQDLRQLLRDGV